MCAKNDSAFKKLEKECRVIPTGAPVLAFVRKHGGGVDGYGQQLILILFIDCRSAATHRGELPKLVIPAKLVLNRVEGAGIQALSVNVICNLFGNF